MRRVLVVVAILLAPYAAADPIPRERAAVVAIELGPSKPTYLQEKAANQILAGLTAAGYEVMPAAEVEARLTVELARCREGACVRRAGEALGVQSLVFVRIDGEDESTAVTIRLHDGVTGERVAEVHEICELCGETELSARVGIAAAALRARALEQREHALEQRDRAASRRAAAAAGPPAVAATRAGERRSMLPGVLLGTAGAAAVAAGLYLVVIDGRGTCDGDAGPAFPDPGAVIRHLEGGGFECREVYRTQTLGIASAGIGVAAVAAGVALTVRARHRDRIFEIAPRPGGALIGVSGSW